MKIFDTLTGSQKELGPTTTPGARVRIYLCGVTVYDESHIGHARTIIVFDVLRRFLESQGMQVEFVQNFTDVDDKIINRAQKQGVRASEISSKYIKRYYEDFDALNIKRATRYPKATEHIVDMQNMIQGLVDKNIAYTSKNGVYFDVSKFDGYGKLSKKKTEELLSGARVQVDEEKNDPLDFALWKFSGDEPSWDSPWGKGRPGWHIECSAMSVKYLGENFEIHGGGRDLIFPHHENEIAQSESFTTKPFAKIWMHVGMITIKGEKMAKSLGNFKSVSHVLDDWGPNVIRLFCLFGHYSKPIDYSEELLKEGITKWRQVETCYYEIILVCDAIQKKQSNQTEQGAQNLVSDCQNSFNSALNNDFNTHLALVAFFKLVKEINRLAADELLTKTIAEMALLPFERMLDVLGLNIPRLAEEEKTHVNQLIKKRDELRAQKSYDEADKLRKQLAQLDVELIDHKNTTTWMKKEKIKSENNTPNDKKN